MLNKVTALAFFSFFGSLGCAPTEAGPPKVSDITITNLEPAQIWGTSDTITEIRDLAFASDSSVWVLNKNAPYLIKFGRNGKIERVWGNHGGGPGEFLRPEGLTSGRGGTEIWVRDAGKGVFLQVAGSTDDPPSTRVADSVELISMGFDRDNPLWSVQSDSGVWAVRGTHRTRPKDGPSDDKGPSNEGGPDDQLAGYTAEIIEIRPNGSFGTRLDLDQVLGDPAKSYPGASEFLPYPLWAVCPDRTIGVYDPTANIIRRVAANGKLIDSILLPPAKMVEITFDRAFRMFYNSLVSQAPADLLKDTARFKEEMRKGFEKDIAKVAKFFPEYFDFRCDPMNRLWIQPFDYAAGDLGRGPLWYQVAPKAVPKGFMLPSKFQAMEFGVDRIWGVARNEDDVPAVAWVKLPR